MSLRLPYELLLDGGGGRANGLGGPVAPALSSELALGEGGGKTTPEECDASVLRPGVAPVVPESLGDESAVALPPSECSLGICTRSLGLLSPIRRLFVRDGGGITGTADVDCVLCGGCWGGACGGCGWDLGSASGCDRAMAATSIDCARFSCLRKGGSLRGAFALLLLVLLLPQCAASIDWLSSIGVKMLCLADACNGFGCGRGGLWKLFGCGGDGTVMVGCSGRSCCGCGGGGGGGCCCCCCCA